MRCTSICSTCFLPRTSRLHCANRALPNLQGFRLNRSIASQREPLYGCSCSSKTLSVTSGSCGASSLCSAFVQLAILTSLPVAVVASWSSAGSMKWSPPLVRKKLWSRTVSSAPAPSGCSPVWAARPTDSLLAQSGFLSTSFRTPFSQTTSQVKMLATTDRAHVYCARATTLRTPIET